jgi:MFS family permease
VFVECGSSHRLDARKGFDWERQRNHHLPADKKQSLRALDALNFSNAGILTGLGPFMSIFYTTARHWNPAQIGILLAAQSVVGIAVQPWVGSFVDETHHKRPITAGAALIVAVCAASIVVFKNYAMQWVVQLILGSALTVIPAATSAFALGLSDAEGRTRRIARNETLEHTGNMVFAVIAGLSGLCDRLPWIFFAASLFAGGMLCSVLFIRESDVDYEQSRGGAGNASENAHGRAGWRDLFRDHRILIFTAAALLFNLANGATLPLIGEILSQKRDSQNLAAVQIAAALLVAELVMIGTASYTGRKADAWGRKPLFLTAFAFLAVRDGFSIFSHRPYFLISLQACEGVAAAITGVLITLVSADLAKGTGRFNFLQGSVQSAMGIGSLLSNAVFGFIAKSYGFNISFLGLAAVAIGGGALYQAGMTETARSQKNSS